MDDLSTWAGITLALFGAGGSWSATVGPGMRFVETGAPSAGLGKLADVFCFFFGRSGVSNAGSVYFLLQTTAAARRGRNATSESEVFDGDGDGVRGSGEIVARCKLFFCFAAAPAARRVLSMVINIYVFNEQWFELHIVNLLFFPIFTRFG